MANNLTLAFPPAFCQQFFDRNGNPLSGGRLYTFAAGTRTSIVTYKTIGSTSSANRNTNPIVLDSAGYANLVLEVGQSYRFILTDRFGFVIKEWDNVTGGGGQGTYLGKYTVAEINAMVTDNLHNGDYVITSDSGIVNLGPGGVGFDVEAGEYLILYKFGSTVQWDSMDVNFKTKQTAVTDPTADGNGLSFIDSITQNENGEITPHKKTVQDGTTAQKGVVKLNNAINSTSTTEAATPKAVKDAYDELNNKIVARAVFLSQAEWAVQSQIPGDPAKVYYVENGTGEDVYTVYVWKESTSEYKEVDESSIDLDGYWHDSPTTTGNGNVVTGINLGNDGVPVLEKGITALTQHQDISGKLDKTGDASDTTSSLTKASGDESSMTSGSKLSEIFTAISSFFASILSAFNNKADKVHGATAGNFASLDVDGNLTDSGKKATDFKTTQTAVTDPTADGNGLSFIDSVSQDTNGKITPHKKTVQDGTTAQKGVVQLQDSIGSTESATDKAVTPHAVREAINTAVSSAYHAAGSKTVAQLTSSLLVAGNEGSVYNITDSGTTTSDFVDGAGHPINAGANVAVCDVGGGVYKFDLLSGFVDLSNYLAKTGDSSNTTSTLTKNASDASSMTSGSKLSVLFTAISDFFASLKALAFKDTVGTSDIADDAITAAKVKDNETLPVNVSGNAATASAAERGGYLAYGTACCSNAEIGSYSMMASIDISSVQEINNAFLLAYMHGNTVKTGCAILELSIKKNVGVVPKLLVLDNEFAVNNDILVTQTTDTVYIYSSNKVKEWFGIRCIPMYCGTWGSSTNSYKQMILYDSQYDQTKLGTDVTVLKYNNVISDATSTVGSPSIPVHVDSNGQVRPCTPSSMSVGHASALTPGGNAGQVLMSNGSGTEPSWGDITSAQTKHSNRNTVGGASVVPYNTSTDNFSIGIEYDKANSRAFIKVYNYTVGRQLYVSLGHSSNLTPVAYNNNATITSTLSEYYLSDLDILCMGTGDDMPVYSFTIAIQVNENFCQYTVYDKMMYRV